MEQCELAANISALNLASLVKMSIIPGFSVKKLALKSTIIYSTLKTLQASVIDIYTHTHTHTYIYIYIYIYTYYTQIYTSRETSYIQIKVHIILLPVV